ncbi:porin family protein [Draconibacterium sp. IB214405]|uniref:type IX secretion/gliding motility protein PorT/SprT n=1 Tax=Draconibacterium sp. IB214405 TaxID=3097352 RepID=UPI002A0F1699|nr:porin family protein [Draconibacterium sp. IB214405]MDX8338706.1 porin family protein [Draconibacterium sp. IB214405]
MKKVFITIILLIAGGIVFAQKQKINYLTTFDDKLFHFGFTIGMNTLDFNVVNYNPIGENPEFVPYPLDRVVWDSRVRSDVASLVPGFTVGIITSMRLSKDLNLRFLPGLSFGERQLTFNVPIHDINVYSSGNEGLPYYTIRSTFLDFPVLIKYKARRINNDRPYVIFGGAYRHDISRTAQEDLIKLKSGGLYAEVGGGWDHYFAFFRFSVEAKFSFGLNDQLGDLPAPTQRLYYAQSIKNLRSKIFTLSFHFE